MSTTIDDVKKTMEALNKAKEKNRELTNLQKEYGNNIPKINPNLDIQKKETDEFIAPVIIPKIKEFITSANKAFNTINRLNGTKDVLNTSTKIFTHAHSINNPIWKFDLERGFSFTNGRGYFSVIKNEDNAKTELFRIKMSNPNKAEFNYKYNTLLTEKERDAVAHKLDNYITLINKSILEELITAYNERVSFCNKLLYENNECFHIDKNKATKDKETYQIDLVDEINRRLSENLYFSYSEENLNELYEQEIYNPDMFNKQHSLTIEDVIQKANVLKEKTDDLIKDSETLNHIKDMLYSKEKREFRENIESCIVRDIQPTMQEILKQSFEVIKALRKNEDMHNELSWIEAMFDNASKKGMTKGFLNTWNIDFNFKKFTDYSYAFNCNYNLHRNNLDLVNFNGIVIYEKGDFKFTLNDIPQYDTIDEIYSCGIDAKPYIYALRETTEFFKNSIYKSFEEQLQSELNKTEIANGRIMENIDISEEQNEVER